MASVKGRAGVRGSFPICPDPYPLRYYLLNLIRFGEWE